MRLIILCFLVSLFICNNAISQFECCPKLSEGYGAGCSNDDSSIPSTCYGNLRIPFCPIRITSNGSSLWTTAEINDVLQTAISEFYCVNFELYNAVGSVTNYSNSSLFDMCLPNRVGAPTTNDEIDLINYINNISTPNFTTINIFFVDDLKLTGDGSCSIIGPSADGVTNIPCQENYIVISKNNSINQGITLIHELGHYFGLLHTWGGSLDAMGSSSCSLGDGIADTPGSANISDLRDCNPFSSSCNLAAAAATVCSISTSLADRLISNYMSYSDDCRNEFTPFQKRKMWDIIREECRDELCVPLGMPQILNTGSPINQETYVLNPYCGELVFCADLSNNNNRSNSGNCVSWSYRQVGQTSWTLIEDSDCIDISSLPAGSYVIRALERAPFNVDCIGDPFYFAVVLDPNSSNCDCFMQVTGCIDLCSSIDCNPDDTYNLEVSVNPTDPNISGCSLVLYDPSTYGGYGSSFYATPFSGVANSQIDNIQIGQCYTFFNIPAGMDIGVQAQMNDPSIGSCEIDPSDPPLCYNTWENNEYNAPECNFHNSAPTICDYPVNLSCSTFGQDVILSWGQVNGAVSYDLCWGYTSAAVNCFNVTTTSYTIEDLDPCEQFLYFKVRTNCTSTSSSSYSPVDQETIATKFSCQLECGFSNIDVFSIDCDFLFGNTPNIGLTMMVSNPSHEFCANAGVNDVGNPTIGNNNSAFWPSIPYDEVNGQICVTVTDKTAGCTETICVEEICDCELGNGDQYLEVVCQSNGGFRVSVRGLPENGPYTIKDNQGNVSSGIFGSAGFPPANGSCYDLPLPSNGLEFTICRENLPSCDWTLEVSESDVANCSPKCNVAYYYIPPSLTINCDQDPLSFNFTGTAYTTCSTCTAPTSTIVQSSGGCNGTGAVVRNWTYTDECNITHAETQTITIIDDGGPILIVPDDLTIVCNADPSDLDLTGNYIIASDNCTTTLTPTYSDSGTLMPGGTVIRTWTVTDACGNTTTETQEITMSDICVSIATIDDPCSCSDPMNYLLNGTYYYHEVVEVTGMTGQTWNMTSVTSGSAFDASGNVLALPFLGTETPVGSGIYIWEFWHTSAVGFCAEYTETGTGQVLDVCNTCTLPALAVRCPAVTDLGTYDCSSIGTVPACPTTEAMAAAAPYSITIDNTSNSVDNPAPCENIIVTCTDDATPNACGTMSQTINRTVTLIDDLNGNGVLDAGEMSASCIYTYTITPDITDPVISCPAAATVFMDAMCTPDLSGLSAATATDDCPGMVTISFMDISVLTGCTGNANPYGLITRTYTATDACGNDSTCDQLITVEDNTAPMAVCQDITVELDATGNAVISAAQIDGGSSDNCADPVMLSAATTSFTCADLTGTGPGCSTDIPVVLTVTDDCGNFSMCTATSKRLV